FEADCDTGAVEDFGVADPSTIRAYNFANPAPGVYTCQLEAFAANPVVGPSWNGGPPKGEPSPPWSSGPT
ncbi:MAG: hypothetical protein ACRD0P_39535, partial [Stackebrandtia sp.]